MRRLRRARPYLLVPLALLLLIIAFKEFYDPYLVLFLDDLLHPKPGPLTVSLTDQMAVRLYSNTQPRVGKVASIQKGLVLVYQGEEQTEEGFGFGMPIIQVGDVAYLSRNASTALVQEEGATTLVKAFTIDVVDRPTRLLRVKYPDAEPLGTVVFSYTLQAPDTISVDVDFSGLNTAWDRAYLMNEQGAINFPTYEDAQGQLSDQMGRWQPVEAPLHCWRHKDGALRFCVETEPGRLKYVGRERYNQYRWTGIFYLSWSGIDIEIGPPLSRYRYTVRVELLP